MSRSTTTPQPAIPPRLRTALVGVAAAAALLGPVAPAARAADGCLDASAAATVEESRLQAPVPGLGVAAGPEFQRRGGYTSLVSEFVTALCGTRDAATATATVERYGTTLWQNAVARAQGSGSATSGSLPVDDDRPLYWARLAMTLAIRQWQPSGFAVQAADRTGWLHRFEYASRGLTTADFTGTSGVRRLFVSGFDPFSLDDDLRHSNPSGSIALRLDGRVVTVGGARVEIQAVMLPVRYADFTDGIVEDAFGPHLASGRQHADLMSTISQGRVGQFDLEAFNGRRRSATAPDNLRVQGGGTTATPYEDPRMGAGPEFVASTLPLAAMQSASTGDFPVRVNRAVVALNRTTRAVGTFDGPPSGSGWIAVEGGGGGYLSNESAYRVTRLVLAAGTGQPAGHLHTPVLEFDPSNSNRLTDASLEANRTRIVTQAERILLAGISVG